MLRRSFAHMYTELCGSWLAKIANECCMKHVAQHSPSRHLLVRYAHQLSSIHMNIAKSNATKKLIFNVFYLAVVIHLV